MSGTARNLHDRDATNNSGVWRVVGLRSGPSNSGGGTKGVCPA